MPERCQDEWVIRSRSGRVIARMPEGCRTLNKPTILSWKRMTSAESPRRSRKAWTAIASPPGPLAAGPEGARLLAEGARRLRQQTDRAIIGLFGGNLLEMGQFFYRNDNFFDAAGG